MAHHLVLSRTKTGVSIQSSLKLLDFVADPFWAIVHLFPGGLAVYISQGSLPLTMDHAYLVRRRPDEIYSL